ETELWNMTVKGNDLTAYTQRFLIFVCTRMVPYEEDRVERFIGGLPDNIQGNVIAMNLGVETVRRLGTRLGIVGLLLPPNTQGATVGNQQGNVCYECGRPGHFRKDYPKLRNQNRGNQTRNKSGNKTGGNEITSKAYAIGGRGKNPDSNVVTGTFLLNNYYASMLFDSGAHRGFVSSTFSALLDVAPSTLDTSYAVELADGRVSETNIILRGDNYDDESKLNIISCTKTQKYIQKGCQVYLAQVTSKKAEDKSEEK
nr:hypothetical protein [Tanacetum cinerariifolium]